MDIIFMDGGELGTRELWDYRGKTITAGAVAAGFTGNYYYTGNYPNGKNITARSSLYVMCRYKGGNDRKVFTLYGNNGTSFLCQLNHVSDNGYLDFYNGYTRWVGNMAIQDTTVYRIEMYWLRSTYSGGYLNDGAVTVKVNGVICLQQTNIRTIGNNYDCDEVMFGENWAQFDDCIIVADEWPGNLRIQAIWPDNDDVTSWDCSTGADHAALVDKAASVGEVFTTVDADYNYTNTVDEEETYTMSNLAEGSNPIDTIAAVQVSIRCKQEGTATPQQIQVIARHGTTSGYSSSLSVEQDAYAYRSQVFGDNPATSAEWTPTEVNAMKAGMKSKT